MAQTAHGFVWCESPLATAIKCKLPYMVLEFPTLPYKAMGFPQTGQGIQCRVMEYTFCHFIVIIAKYNK